MPESPSRNQITKLGKRLRDAATPTDADLLMLEAVLQRYDAALQETVRNLVEMGFEPTDRIKTTGTLIDKLRRSPSMALPNMQDVAGARITIDGTRLDQDEAVLRIVQGLGTARYTIVDRRELPSSGYRAVHITAMINGFPVEIQVRTRLQDLWAQLFEKLGDRWGRGIRYGGDPLDPDAPAIAPPDGSTTAATVPTRRELCRFLTADISGTIDFFERAGAELISLTQQLDRLVDGGAKVPPELRVRLDVVKNRQHDAEKALSTIIGSWRELLEGMA